MIFKKLDYLDFEEKELLKNSRRRQLVKNCKIIVLIKKIYKIFVFNYKQNIAAGQRTGQLREQLMGQRTEQCT